MKNLRPFLIPSLITFVGIAIIFMIAGFFFGQRAPLLLIPIFWLVIPYIAVVIAARFKKVNTLATALCGMILSFAFILLLIYKRLDTDFGIFFQISFVVNLVMIPLYWYMRNNVAESPKLKL